MKIYIKLGLTNKTRIKRFEKRKPINLNLVQEKRRMMNFKRRHHLTQSRNTIEID